jgi:hypothetical protein
MYTNSACHTINLVPGEKDQCKKSKLERMRSRIKNSNSKKCFKKWKIKRQMILSERTELKDSQVINKKQAFISFKPSQASLSKRLSIFQLLKENQ